MIPRFELLTLRIAELILGCRLLKVPALVTEQYPAGLGHTAAEIMGELGETVPVFEKSTFSAWGTEAFRAELRRLGRSHVILCGIETHICVGQTARELLREGFAVHVVEDAVASRLETDRETGLKRLYMDGALPTTVETALFEMTRDSKHPLFKDIQKISKYRADAASADEARAGR